MPASAPLNDALQLLQQRGGFEPLTHRPRALILRRMDRAQIGRDAEARAAQRLQAAGFTLLRRNYRCRMGELDLIARRADLLVIAEVRLRTRADFGGAAASISAAKRLRIVRAARHLLRTQPALARLRVRFDALLLSAQDGPIEWIEGAFDAT